jgi:hypothetical protein
VTSPIDVWGDHRAPAIGRQRDTSLAAESPGRHPERPCSRTTDTRDPTTDNDDYVAHRPDVETVAADVWRAEIGEWRSSGLGEHRQEGGRVSGGPLHDLLQRPGWQVGASATSAAGPAAVESGVVGSRCAALSWRGSPSGERLGVAGRVVWTAVQRRAARAVAPAVEVTDPSASQVVRSAVTVARGAAARTSRARPG